MQIRINSKWCRSSWIGLIVGRLDLSKAHIDVIGICKLVLIKSVVLRSSSNTIGCMSVSDYFKRGVREKSINDEIGTNSQIFPFVLSMSKPRPT